MPDPHIFPDSTDLKKKQLSGGIYLYAADPGLQFLGPLLRGLLLLLDQSDLVVDGVQLLLNYCLVW